MVEHIFCTHLANVSVNGLSLSHVVKDILNIFTWKYELGKDEF